VIAVAELGDALVFFGASGDLARKMIFPALYRLVRAGRLDVPVVGVAHSDWTVDRLRDRAQDSVTRFGDGQVDRVALDQLVDLLRYVDGDYDDDGTFEALRVELGGCRRPVHYLAIPPSLFGRVVYQLGAHDCAREGRVVVEKPFGRDLASAADLNTALRAVFPEGRVCRIDHFLGEEAIRNAAYIRMANDAVDALFRRDHVVRVQLTMAEDFGVEDRGSFYDSVGCLLDVVQNHLLQIVTLLAMDTPSPHAPDSLRAEQSRLLGSVRPLAVDDIVRGQYHGYRDTVGVRPDSDTETFVAVRLWIDSPRWAGVPFLIRAGKRLPVTVTEAVVELRDPLVDAFSQLGGPLGSTQWRFRFHPDEAVTLRVRTLDPGRDPPTTMRDLVLSQHDAVAQTPYERLLGAALEGSMTPFVRQDTVEASWRIVEPVLHDRPATLAYAPGSWGPEAADALAMPGGWHDPSYDDASLTGRTKTVVLPGSPDSTERPTNG
jgi:glucose-6-phosphate 1-dehydrogenase